MKRKRVILAVVLLVAVVAVVAPFWWEIWLWVAYEEKTSTSVEYLKKRASWLPGNDYVVPNQLCRDCGKRYHDDCAQDFFQRGSSAWIPPFRGWDPRGPYRSEPISVPPTWRCLCPDPSHGDR